MKTLKQNLLTLGCGLGLLATTWAQEPLPPQIDPPDSEPVIVVPIPVPDDPGEPPEDQPGPPFDPDMVPIPPPSLDEQEMPVLEPDQRPAFEERESPGPAQAPIAPGPTAPASPGQQPPTTPPAERSEGSDLMQFMPPPGPVVADGEKGLRLNFKNAPLEMVLNYLSDAAGFIIVPEVDVHGRVDVWSNQPLDKEEAIEVLNSVLNKNGLAALQNGRMLLIIDKEQAKTRDIPVKSGSNPEDIPRSEEIVTQIIPVKYISATSLIRDLQPLLPTSTTMTANEGGNSLVITDTQINIKRMAEIVQALDTALSSVASVRVFPLKFADAKSLATVIKDLFEQQDSSRSNNGRSRFSFRGRDGGPPGSEGGSSSAGGGRAPTVKVVAVADERSNSLVVSAPVEQMPIIEDLVKQVDMSVEDITEVRVFHLKYADAQETADLLSNLFPDNSRNQNSSRSRFQFGGRPPFGPFGSRGSSNNSDAQSDRALKETRVVAVPDMRTRSVVVSASRELMPQIAGMIEELDADPAKKQKVHVYSLENTDPLVVQELLQSLFPSQNNRNYNSTRNNSRQAGNQLNNRATQMQNQGSGRTTSGFGGNNSFGSGFGSGTSR